jgi:hypothetical protein
MGVVSAAADALVAVFSLTIAVAAPRIAAQSVLPHTLYPAPLLELKRWYAAEFGDYLVAQPPGFFRGLVCLELAFQWPLAVATLYGILTRRRWAATTSLMAGVATLTSMVKSYFPSPLVSCSGATSLVHACLEFRETGVSPPQLCPRSKTLPWLMHNCTLKVC